MKETTILLADDHVMLLEGIKLYLERQHGLRVVAMVQTGAEALDFLRHHPTDLVILDINMAESNGLSTLRQVKHSHPDVRCIVLSMYQEPTFVQESMAAGADGYVFKSRAGNELLTAIQSVLAGEPYFPNLPAASFSKEPAADGHPVDEAVALHSLTKREKEILLLLCQDLSTKELADRLFTSVHTVETHRRNLLRKVGVRSVGGLVSFAQRNRIFLSENKE